MFNSLFLSAAQLSLFPFCSTADEVSVFLFQRIFALPPTVMNENRLCIFCGIAMCCNLFCYKECVPDYAAQMICPMSLIPRMSV